MAKATDTTSRSHGAKSPARGRKPQRVPDPLQDAITYEQGIADEAAAIRGEIHELTPDLYLRLLPLLKRPIPAGFIVSTPKTGGKPYASTGIKSMQVQVDRLDNVLTPLWWGWKTDYSEDGRLADVAAWIGDKDSPLVCRRARGGVDRGSTLGNVYKGSETNAGKLALARLGPGHQVYLGATDLDPDVSPEAAKQQERGEGSPSLDRKVTDEQAANLEVAVKAAALSDHLATKLASFGAKAITDLTVEQGLKIYEWAKADVARG